MAPERKQPPQMVLWFTYSTYRLEMGKHGQFLSKSTGQFDVWYAKPLTFVQIMAIGPEMGPTLGLHVLHRLIY